MHHVGITLNDHVVRHLHSAGLRHAPDIIAAEVHQHYMLGDFFRIGE